MKHKKKAVSYATTGNILHIVFNASEISLLKNMLSLDETIAGDVIQIRDDFAVGPLNDIDNDQGWMARSSWWTDLLKDSPYQDDPQCIFDDRTTVASIRQRLDAAPNSCLWIWMGQNQHDVCGYYWLIPQLKDYHRRIQVNYLNNLPFINEKGQLFYPSWLHEIQPKELLKAKRLARPVSLSEFELDTDEWRRFSNEGSVVRVLEGGKKIIGRDETFYDQELLKNLTPDWQKATRVLTNTLHRMKIKTGDVFLMWRMKQLIMQGKIEVLGNVSEGWKEFDVRLPSANVEVADVAQTENNGSSS